jgi:hypothetical protein
VAFVGLGERHAAAGEAGAANLKPLAAITRHARARRLADALTLRKVCRAGF